MTFCVFNYLSRQMIQSVHVFIGKIMDVKNNSDIILPNSSRSRQILCRVFIKLHARQIGFPGLFYFLFTGLHPLADPWRGRYGPWPLPHAHVQSDLLQVGRVTFWFPKKLYLDPIRCNFGAQNVTEMLPNELTALHQTS